MLAKAVFKLGPLPGHLTLVPVPLASQKLGSRGFNQSALMAKAALPLLRRHFPSTQFRVEERMLVRVRATESQAGLNAAQRRRNLRGAFFVPNRSQVKGKNILLLDDIYTSGATARACTTALLSAGAASIRVATLSRSQRMSAIRWQPSESFTEASFFAPAQPQPQYALNSVSGHGVSAR
jgi:ComF family protein